MNKKQEIEDLERQLMLLLNKKSYICTKRACTGKYRGYYDYSLMFQDGSQIWISCGRKRYEPELRDKVSKYTFFRNNHAELEEQTRRMIERDNRQAAALGLAPVKLIRLELIEEKTNNYAFWVRAILEQNGRQFSKLETMFKYACLGYCTYEYFAEKQNRPDEALGGLKDLGLKSFSAIIFGYLWEQKNLEWR